MLPQYAAKIKVWAGENRSDIYIAAIIFLVGLSSFGLGRLSVLWPQKEPIIFEEAPATASGKKESDSPARSGASKEAAAAADAILKAGGKYVASKSGSAYHYPWCPGALKIREDNKIWFETATEAEKRGYRPAKNCPGME